MATESWAEIRVDDCGRVFVVACSRRARRALLLVGDLVSCVGSVEVEMEDGLAFDGFWREGLFATSEGDARQARFVIRKAGVV